MVLAKLSGVVCTQFLIPIILKSCLFYNIRLFHSDCVKYGRVGQLNARVNRAEIENSLSYCVSHSELCRSEQAFLIYLLDATICLEFATKFSQGWPKFKNNKLNFGIFFTIYLQFDIKAFIPMIEFGPMITYQKQFFKSFKCFLHRVPEQAISLVKDHIECDPS